MVWRLIVAAGIVLSTSMACVLPVRAAGDAKEGHAFAVKHCSRCHVIPDYNPHGGLGSAPSFRSLASVSDYRDRFRTFYARRPHPVFVDVPKVAPLARR